MFQWFKDGRACACVFCSKDVLWVRLLKCALLLLLVFQTTGIAVAEDSVPVWTGPIQLTSSDGFATLNWELSEGDSARFFKITETFRGKVSVHFTEARELRAWRVEPGVYEFVLQACAKSSSQDLICGSASAPLVLKITKAVTNTLFTGVVADPAQVFNGESIESGPDRLSPGHWESIRKHGHGWSFYWSNRLSLPENDPLFGNSYDLVGIWYTFEAKVAQSEPGCTSCAPITSAYRPVALKLKAISTGPDTFGGSLYVSQSDGSEIWVGSAEIKFASNNYQATINWTANFKKESLSDSDPLNLSLGPSTTNTESISHFNGIWGSGADSDFFIVTTIGENAEVLTAVFHDDAGDPTWIMGVRIGKAVSSPSSFCTAYLTEGYSPVLDRPADWNEIWYATDCSPSSHPGTFNKNSTRYFSGLNEQFLWLDFPLPDIPELSGSIRIGSESTPVVLTKAASFNAISYQSSSGSTCELISATTTCEVQLTWYMDGYFPSATIFAHNGSTNVFSRVTTASQSSVVGFPYQVTSEGVYEFELRMDDDEQSTLIAKTDLFTVTNNIANSPPELITPEDQTNNNGETVELFLIANDPDEGDVLTFNVNGLPVGLDVDEATGRISGTLAAFSQNHLVTATVEDNHGGHDTKDFSWNVMLTGSNPETPPPPAAPPNMTASTSSSKIGATTGEFRVDESGAATYSIPILTAPASGGVKPQVSLNYSSLAGNGDIGVGWTLAGISTISLCPQSMEQDDVSGSRGIGLDGEDRFCLDGQRLIVDPSSGEYGDNGTQYRTEIDSFARITSFGSAGNGPAWFKVERKDGSVIEYGNSVDSRIEARGSHTPATVFTWAQNRLEDHSGNYILYSYLENSSGPVAFVLQAIDYTGNVHADSLPSARLSFIYSDRGNATDVAHSYFAGVQMEQRYLLQSIHSQGRLQAGSPLEDLRFYELSYDEDGVGRKILSTLTECRSANRTICYQATRFNWLKSESKIETPATTLDGLLPKTTLSGLLLADVSGDGRPDLVYTESKNRRHFLHVKTATENTDFIKWAGSYKLPEKADESAPRVLAIDLNSDGIQDVVYSKYTKVTDSYTWVALISNGSEFSAEIELRPDHRFYLGAGDLESRVRVMDFNGDGLSDILHAHNKVIGNTWHLTVLLNKYVPGGSPGLLAPIEVDVDNADMFPTELPGGWELSTRPSRHNWGVYDTDKNEIPDARIFDFNGDGAVDLLLKVWRQYEKCVANCVLPAVGSDGGNGSDTTAVYQRVTASFWVLMVSNGQNAFFRHSIVALGEDCTALSVCGAPEYEGLPYSNHVWPVDVNADGLADLSWGDRDGYWFFQTNTGAGFVDAAIIGQVPGGINKLVRFEDWNGDAYFDLIYPSGELSADAKWMVYQNHFGRTFAAVVNTQVSAGNVGGDADIDTVENDVSVFADYDGDGKTDQLQIDRNKHGKILSALVRKGVNVSGNKLVEPTNVITMITNGQGVKTEISYKPLTDSGVYSRMHNSANAFWGNGSAVYDLIAPIYVVSQVYSSAPTYNDPLASSQLQYHYVGAKIQAGGRGYLGFGEVISYDPQSQIRTNTRYRQDFPFIGLPLDTTRVSQAAETRFDPISQTASSTPNNWGIVTSTTSFPSAVSGIPLSYALNQWQSHFTTDEVVFPYIADSIEINYTLDGSIKGKTLTGNSYDVYGNLTSSSVSTYATEAAVVFSSQKMTNTYTNHVSQWLLGRLSSSKVTHSRAGKPSITRQSSFAYDPVSGILNQEVIEPDSTVFKVTTDYQIDVFGNRNQTTVTGVSETARKASAKFDQLGRFVIENTNALNQVTQKINTWDVFGNPLVMENIDGVVTIAAADHMGRLFVSYTETGVWSKTINDNGPGSDCPGNTIFRVITFGGGSPTQFNCFDLLGRTSRSAVNSLDGRYIYTDQYYDSSGRVARVSEPYFVGDTPYWNLTVYDDLGRVTAVLSASGDDTTLDYDNQAGNNCVVVGTHAKLTINGLNQQLVEISNVLGETESVYDDQCGLVSYDYDATGNLIKVTGADGETVTMTYDLSGRKTAMHDPDKGYWQYAYNSIGEMSRQLDSKNQAVDFTYDVLGRVTNRRELKEVSSLGDSIFTTVNRETTFYQSASPAKSQVAAVTYRSGELGSVLHKKAFIYDIYGRVDLINTTIAGEQFVEQITYDQYSRVFQQFDASGDYRGLRHIYSNGYVSKLREAREGLSGIVYKDIQAMDARGNVTVMHLGNGVDVYASYEPESGRLINLSAFDVSGVELMEVDYLFDVMGNLKKRHDLSIATNLKEVFEYDPLNRLTSVGLSVNAGASAQTLSLDYDAAGNITDKSDVGSYLYNGLQPHAVSSAGGVSYRYDLNGNQVSGGGRVVTYTVFDKPDSMTKGSSNTNFYYGVGNQRYRRQDHAGSELKKSTLYLGPVERISENGTAFFKRYLGGVAIANYYPTSGLQQLGYLLKDHIGSIHSVLDEDGLITASMHFNAFGERQDTDWQTPLSSFLYAPLNDITTRGYTGHEQVDSVGIVHMNGRVYDPKLGRFLQADPVVQAPKNSQSLNRYSYVLNNPLSYTDPSGYFSLKKLWRKARSFVAIGLSIWMPGSSVIFGSLAGGLFAASTTGFVAGYVATGSIKGAVIGAFTAAAFYGVGSSFEQYSGSGSWGGSGLSGQAFAEKSVLHGLVGGAGSAAGGGKFGHGFLSAGVTQAFSGRVGRLKTAYGKVAAAATVGGTISAITGGKFANGAMTGAFSRAFNDQLHPFVQKTIHLLQERKFWTEFISLTPTQFRSVFPNLASGWDDFGIGLVQQHIFDLYYRSELPGQVLDAALAANDLLRDYTIGRVTGIVGASGKIASILGRSAGLSGAEINLIMDTFAIKAFADQQSMSASQLGNLADILIQSNQTINDVLLNLQNQD